MSWLDALLGRIRSAGVDLVLGSGINFTSPLRATLNASTSFVDVSLPELADSSIVPANLAASITFGVPFLITVSMTAGAAGTADDVTVYAGSAPFAFRILDCWTLINTAVGGSTLQLRSATGGGGSALSSSLSSAATGTVRNNDTASRPVAINGSVYIRRSDRAVAGRVLILALRE